MKRWTLRARLTALYGGLFFVAGAVLLGVTYLLVQNSVQAQLRSQADARVTAMREEAAKSGGAVDQADVQAIREAQERVRDAALGSLLTQGGLALGGVGVLACGFGWLVAGRALRPLQRITETTQRIAGASGRGLHERIALAGPRDEVKQLADSFDAMLEQLDRSFDGQRRFVANASHELRTPLTLNRALVELVTTDPDAGAEVRRLGATLLDVNDRHARLIDGLLTLADSENPLSERRPVDLAEIAGHVVDVLGAKCRSLELTSAPALGDPVLLERLAHNLVENAIRHNIADGWLSVRTSVSGELAELTVTNAGESVPAYEIESWFEPFRRGGDRRTGADRGFGLGLSIVRAIANAHGGSVRAEPREGGGLVVTVGLPLVSGKP
ncbi:sensor histidine kinase [Flindersiella endophytica]